MDKIVIKRDFTKVPFDIEKVKNALVKAFIEVDGTIYEWDTINSICEDVENSFTTSISVEEIQDYVEELLMLSERKDVAKAYIRYRYKKEIVREHKNDLMREVGKKIKCEVNTKQNANVDEESFGGRAGEANDIVMKDFALNYCMSEKSKKNHLNNEVYIHDLSHYALGDHNCLSIPFDDLLANGFNTRQTDVRPANSANTAMQLVAVIFQLQSLQQFGGVSSTHLDWTMVPYVRKSFVKHFKDGLKYIEDNDFDFTFNLDYNIADEDYWNDQGQHSKVYKYALAMTEKEIYQAVEGLYHNLNTLQSRSGNQLPFTSINYGTCTLPEGRMVTKALLDVLYKGLGKLHKTSVFPCGIFQMKTGINRKPEDPNYDLFQLALKCTAKRLYPNYANCDWSGNAGYDPNDPRTYFSTMGKCKLQLI